MDCDAGQLLRPAEQQLRDRVARHPSLDERVLGIAPRPLLSYFPNFHRKADLTVANQPSLTGPNQRHPRVDELMLADHLGQVWHVDRSAIHHPPTLGCLGR
jgi:hypothetical protein